MSATPGTAKGRAVRAGATTPTDRKPRAAIAARAEVAAEDSATDGLPGDGSLRVVAMGADWDVKSPADWRGSAFVALNDGLFNTWADTSLYPESAARWARRDPTMREAMEFIGTYEDAFQARYGDDFLDSGVSLRSSASTPRR